MRSITVYNRKKGTSVENVYVSENIFSNALGLMFRKKGRMLLVFRAEGFWGIWMLFMRFGLDLVFMDKNKKIVDIKEDVKPISVFFKSWKVYYPKGKSMYLLEIESGLSKTKKLSVGDIIEFNEK